MPTYTYTGPGTIQITGYRTVASNETFRVPFQPPEVALFPSRFSVNGGEGNLAPLPLSQSVVEIPAALGWDKDNYPISLFLNNYLENSIGSCSHTPEQIFGFCSVALSAPTTTYYVSTGGSDGNTGLSTAQSLRSIHAAITKANATGQPARVFVAAGEYPRANNFSNNTVYPTVDIAFVATGGRVIAGTHDAYTAPTADATFTLTYSWALTNVSRVVDLLDRVPGSGLYRELAYVSSPTLCNNTPNSWTLSGGNIYIRRADGLAVTNANTRVYRAATANLKTTTTPVSLYLGGESGNDGFDLEGGDATAVANLGTFTSASGRDAIVAKNCTFRYGGGQSGLTARGMWVGTLNGIAAFFNCDASGNQTDGWNFHRDLASTVTHVLTMNCTAYSNGRLQTSSNSWTLHDDVVGIDVAGWFEDSAGGNVRSIQTTRQLLAGTVIVGDRGDIIAGGSVGPTGIAMSDTAKAWLDRVLVRMPAGSIGIQADSGTEIYMRNIYPTRQPFTGNGLFLGY